MPSSRRGALSILLAAGLLSGCFSSHLVKEIDRWDEARTERAPALELTPTSLPVEIAGRRVCRDRPIYRLPATSPLYLDLSEARLTDEPPTGCDSVDGPERLRLIVSATPVPFHPSTAGDVRTALLVLDLREPGRGESRRLWHLGLNSRLVYSDSVAVQDRRLEPDLRLQEVRPPLAPGRKGLGWLALTIPLDIVTSPIQLVVAAVGGATLLVLGAMLGGHPW